MKKTNNIEGQMNLFEDFGLSTFVEKFEISKEKDDVVKSTTESLPPVAEEFKTSDELASAMTEVITEAEEEERGTKNKWSYLLVEWVPESGDFSTPDDKRARRLLLGTMKKFRVMTPGLVDEEDLFQSAFLAMFEMRQNLSEEDIPIGDKAARIFASLASGKRWVMRKGLSKLPEKGDMDKLSEQAKIMAELGKDTTSLSTPVDSGEAVVELSDFLADETVRPSGVDDEVFECFLNKQGSGSVYEEAMNIAFHKATAAQYHAFEEIYIKRHGKFAIEEYASTLRGYSEMSEEEKRKLKNNISHMARKVVKILEESFLYGELSKYAYERGKILERKTAKSAVKGG